MATASLHKKSMTAIPACDPQDSLRAQPEPVTNSSDRILRLPKVLERTGLSKTAVYTLPDFPRPVKLTSISSGWIEREIDAWVAARIAERDSGKAASTAGGTAK